MSFLVIGDHHWGHGDDLATAKKNFRANFGRLSSGYTIADFGPNLIFKGVDQMGNVSWFAGSEHGGEEPVVTHVKPRKKRSE